jgi:1,2-phenylacetyl-CoA epoxidase catalytic subunit
LTGDVLSLVDRLLRSQAYRERGAAALFEAALRFAPDEPARQRLAGQVTEERAHYARVRALWAETFTRDGAALDAWVTERLADAPLPPVASWLELAMAQFLFDRAGRWQLSEYLDSSFLPYRALARAIVEDEHGHEDAGAALVVELCGAPDVDRTAAQSAFERWLRIALLSFGRPGGDGNRLAIAAGLKRRDSAEVMRAFLADVEPTRVRARLVFPAPEALSLELPPDGIPDLPVS